MTEPNRPAIGTVAWFALTGPAAATTRAFNADTRGDPAGAYFAPMARGGE